MPSTSNRQGGKPTLGVVPIILIILSPVILLAVVINTALLFTVAADAFAPRDQDTGPTPEQMVTNDGEPRRAIATTTVLKYETDRAPVLLTGGEDRIEDYSDWLDELAALSVDSDYSTNSASALVNDLTTLADTYPIDNSDVSTYLHDAAEGVDKGYDALDSEAFSKADAELAEASEALAAVPSAIDSDLAELEEATGYRLADNGVLDSSSKSRIATIDYWVDGDTVQTSVGRVRLIGIDTPEMNNECAPAEEAHEAAQRIAPAGTTVNLISPASVDDTDKYDRLLAYVVLADGTDVGYSLLLNDLAQPRYDATDGYQWHPRQRAYHRTNGSPEEDALCSWEATAIVALALADGDGDPHEEGRVKRLATLASVLDDASTDFDAVYKDAKAYWKAKNAKTSTSTGSSGGGGSSSSSGSSSGSSSSGGGDLSGYTGCRAYAPGGKTWKPIPCP